MVVTVMDISQMPVVERRGGRGRRTSRGLDSGHATQLSLRQERRRRKGGLAKDEEEFGDTKEEKKVNEFQKESLDKEWGMEKKVKKRGKVKLSLIKEDPTGPRGGPRILETQVELRSPPDSCFLSPIYIFCLLQHSQEESSDKGRRMVGLSVSRLESDLAKQGRKVKEEEIVRRRKTFFWDIQRMVITSAPGITNGQQRRSLVEYRKPEAMSKERAMAVLGLGVKKVTFGKTFGLQAFNTF